MSRLFFSILLLLTGGTLFAQKEYKPLRNYIKSGGNLTQTMGVVQQLEKDMDFKDDPELYYLAALCQRKANEAENLKVYLKQPYDTASFFNTTYGMFDYIIKCDAKDSLPKKDGKIKVKYRFKGYDMLVNYYPNIYNAGIYFTRKKDYANGAKFWSMYIDAARTNVFAKDSLLKRDPKMPRAAFWYMQCAFEQKDYKNVFRYTDLAEKDTANIDLYYQYRAASYALMGDSVKYEEELLRAMREDPDEMSFFSNLADYYDASRQYQKSLKMIDSMLVLKPNMLLIKFAKAIVLYNLKEYDDCITLSKNIIKEDTANVDAYFYIGSSYFNKAVRAEEKISSNINSKNFAARKSESLSLYRESMPYLERYRKLRPEDKDRWAPLLYRIYLALNMEKNFSEMENILNQPAKK